MRAELCPQGVHGDISILQMDKLSFKEGMWSLYCHTVTDYGSSPSPVNRNWIEAKQEIQARLCWGLCGSRREQNQTTASLACWLWRREWVCSLCGVRVEVCPGVRPKGWRVCVCVCVCVCSGLAQYPVLLPTHSFYTPGSSKLAAGVCGLFLFFGSSICSNWACTQLFLVSYGFFVLIFCCSRRAVSRCEHCSIAALHERVHGLNLSHYY